MTTFKSFLTEGKSTKAGLLAFDKYVGKEGWFLRFSNRENPWEMPKTSGAKKSQHSSGEDGSSATPLGMYGWDLSNPHRYKSNLDYDTYQRNYFHFFRVSDSAKILTMTEGKAKDAPSAADLLRVMTKLYWKNADPELVVEAAQHYMICAHTHDNFMVSSRFSDFEDTVHTDPSLPLNVLGKMVVDGKVPKTIFSVFYVLYWRQNDLLTTADLKVKTRSKDFYMLVRRVLDEIGKTGLTMSNAMTKIFVALGYDGIHDLTTEGVIWTYEPLQIVIFDPAVVEDAVTFEADYAKLDLAIMKVPRKAK